MVSQRQKLKERLKKAQKGELSNDELNADWIKFANPAAALEELRVFDFHHFPELGPHRSTTFVNGAAAVSIICGIREGKWTREQVLATIQ